MVGKKVFFSLLFNYISNDITKPMVRPTYKEQNDKLTVKSFLGMTIVILVITGIFANVLWEQYKILKSRSAPPSHEEQLEACIDRGINYFKDIGSYPTLKSELYRGRSARIVAEERCIRTNNREF